MTTTVLNTKISEFENKIPNTSSLVATTVPNTKITESEKNIPDHTEYITTAEFNKLAAEHVASRLKQADLVTKIDFDNNLTSFSRKITSSKTKYLENQKKINSLRANDYNISVGKNYFTSNDEYQNTFVYQPSLNALEIKKRQR